MFNGLRVSIHVGGKVHDTMSLQSHWAEEEEEKICHNLVDNEDASSHSKLPGQILKKLVSNQVDRGPSL